MTSIPYGGETADFEYVRKHPRPNPIFHVNDGRLHCCYIGVFGPYMLSAIRLLLGALRLGLKRAPDLFSQVRLHFVGTSYAANASPTVLPLAEAAAVRDFVSERPERVGYLDAIQLLLDANLILALGSEEAHYTPSKIFPCIMANRPLLAIFHCESSAAGILRQTGAAEPITFDSRDELPDLEEQVYERWRFLLATPYQVKLEDRMHAFAPYTTTAMAARLAGVLDQASMSARQAVLCPPGEIMDQGTASAVP